MSKVEVFSRAAFEAALPRNKQGAPLWVAEGCAYEEYWYTIPVSPGVRIHVRSSVRPDGVSAQSGEDSIRCWLESDDGRTLAKKLNRWTTRLPGWERRMKTILRKLYFIGLMLRCPRCQRVGIISDKEDGKGDFFFCPKRLPSQHGRAHFQQYGCGHFQYIDLEKKLESIKIEKDTHEHT